MTIDVSKALLQIQELLNGMTAAIPNVVLGILVLFILSYARHKRQSLAPHGVVT